jgi:Ca-activated chloride channel family protein
MDTSMNEHTDTSLTDYALGELPDAKRLQLEARLKTDAAARDEVDETRRLSGLLRAGHPSTVGAAADSEAPISASNELREQLILRTAEPVVVAAPSWRRRLRATAAVAAGIALAASILVILDGTLGPRPKVELANWKEPPTVYSTRPSSSIYQLNDSDINPGAATVADGTRLSRRSEQAQQFFKSHDDLAVQVPSTRGDDVAPNQPKENAPVSHDRRWMMVPPQPPQSTVPQVSTFDRATGVSTSPLPSPSPVTTFSAAIAPQANATGSRSQFGSVYPVADLVIPIPQGGLNGFGGLGGGMGGGIGGGPITKQGANTLTLAGTTPAGSTTTPASQGPIIHSPTPMTLGDKLVTSNSTATSTLTPRILVTDGSPEPQTRRFMLGVGVNSNAGDLDGIIMAPALPTGGEVPKTPSPAVGQAEMQPLLLAHQEAKAKYGENHPKVVELESRMKAVKDNAESLEAESAEAARQPQATQQAKLGRLLVRNRADAPNVEFKVDVDADGIADTRWIDLGRPSKPGELQDFQSLTDLMTSTIQPETWREVRSDEELEQRLARHPAYLDVQARLDSVRRAEQEFNTEQYQSEPENPFVRATDEPLSTFSIDVDTASYSNIRRILNTNQIPTPDTVRLEEFLNYFTYDYPTPTDNTPFSVTTEAARCPWNADHTLVRIGLKGREVHRKERPASNLVFLVDVSGSMQDQNKLPLVRESLKMMVGELGDSDRVAIVVYAGSEGVALPPTGGDRKRTILETLDRLESGGSTNGAAGIQLAYQIAADNFIPKGINRVILATDGDFNVGVTSQGELVRLIEEKAKTGVFFSALGYGMGNLKDSTLEQLADKGNGNYAYIDTISEARKVLVEQMSGTLMTIAKDVKIQIEFNPTTVAGYRLLGYENRMLAAQDFNDDKKDAGEIGAGHTVTALYELIPVGKAAKKEVKKLPEVDPLKYQSAPVVPPQSAELAQELLTLKLRYKEPDGDKSKLIETPVKNDVVDYGKASGDFKFASAVAGFGMLLRHSKYHGSATFDAVIELAEAGIGRDVGGYRKEFVELVRKARDLRKR